VTKYNGVWTKTSTKEYVSQGNKISRGLLKLGIKPGDKIGLISTNNRTEWHIMDLGILQIGAIDVPVYPTISIEDYIYIFNNAEIKYVFVSDKDLYEKLLQVKPQVESLKGIFTFDEIPGAANWKEVLDLGENEDNQQEVEDIAKTIQPDDLATLIYTSGTTGRPKGVMLTHKNIVSNVTACAPIITDVTKGLDELKSLSFLPICHIFERMLYYLYVSNGFSIYFAESIDKVGDNLKEVKPQIMTVVPRLIEKVYDKIVDKGAAAVASGVYLSNHEQSDGYPQGHLHIRLLAFVLDYPHRFGTADALQDEEAGQGIYDCRHRRALSGGYVDGEQALSLR
jgi:long-chain acyl-CoA synthetase